MRPALGAIAALDLDSRLPLPFPRGCDPAGEEALVAAIARQRITGLAVAATTAGLLALSEAGLDSLLERHETQLALDLCLERELVQAAATFDRAGITYRALKGPLLAHTVYADPSSRSFGDVDLLVASDSFDAAIAALQPLGFERRFLEPRRGFDARFSKGACLERGDGVEIDLHRTLAPGAFGVMFERAGLFTRAPQWIALGGRPVAALDRELAFVHACFHAALGDHPPRLVPLRDIVELYRAGFDTEAVIGLVGGTECEVVVQRAVGLVDRVIGVRLEGHLPEWARAYRPSRFDRWALRGYADDRRSYAGQVAASMWAMRSARERATYALALAFPARDYVRAREHDYAKRLTRGVRLVQDWRPR